MISPRISPNPPKSVVGAVAGVRVYLVFSHATVYAYYTVITGCPHPGPLPALLDMGKFEILTKRAQFCPGEVVKANGGTGSGTPLSMA